jgi:fatty-acyl-CoA synthase
VHVAMLLEMAADASDGRVVLGSRVGGMGAPELLTAARRVAAEISRRGVEHVGLLDYNTEALPITMFASAIAGVPFAPVNYRLTDDKLQSIVARLAPGLVVAGDEFVPRASGVEGIEVISRDDLLAVAGDASIELDETPTFIDPDEVAILLFTSGTTGDPKAAVLRHRHLTSYIIGTVEFLGAEPDEAQIVSVPGYHIAGISAVLSSLYAGRRIFYLPTFDADEWVQAVRDEGITQAMLVPTMLGRVLSLVESDEQGLPSLRHLSYGGGRMPVELIQRCMDVLPDINYVNAYGLTETSSTIAVLTPEDHRQAMASDDPAVRSRLGSVGQPLPSIELEIRDPDGAVLPPGERGEIYVRGEQVAGEYLGKSVLTDDGWFPTNDAGYLDAGGFLFLEGRLDDVIVRGAENLSPGEIEDTLTSHPAVAEAAVVGVPDPEWGEAVAAAVVLAPGAEADEDELKSYVRDRLRSTKTPVRIQFRDDMPHNETGKLLRRVLKQELAEMSKDSSGSS